MTPPASPGVVFSNASFVVDADDGQLTILRPLSLTLDERRVGIIGANGSGKSTLIRLINGLRTPSSGNVLVNGRDVVKETSAVRREVGFVFTDPDAQLVMPTPIEDIALSLRRLHPEVSTTDGAQRRGSRKTKKPRGTELLQAASDVLAEFGLLGHAHASVHTLSGGEKQLLALAGVLAIMPRVLVCDEPTTLLDLTNSLRISDRLLSVDAQLIVATHDLDLASKMERVLVMSDGAVVFDGAAQHAVEHYRALAHATRNP